MVEFKLNINKKQQTAYFNKKITDTLGYELCTQLNATSAVMYPRNADIEDVIHSVEIILQDLKHQAKLEKKKETSKK